MISNNSNPYRLIVQFVLVFGILGTLSFLPWSKSASIHPLPKFPVISGLLIFSISCIIWLKLFGVSYQHAKGILWGKPEESRVWSCNVSININSEFKLPSH